MTGAITGLGRKVRQLLQNNVKNTIKLQYYYNTIILQKNIKKMKPYHTISPTKPSARSLFVPPTCVFYYERHLKSIL